MRGPVAVCVDRPLLSLDRSFTYDLSPELGATVGSLVKVRFHGRLTNGWVLGATGEIRPRMSPIESVVSPIPRFDATLLELARWVAERYVSPLAAVLGRLAPPRVASEEKEWVQRAGPGEPVRFSGPGAAPESLLAAYAGGDELGSAVESGGAGAAVLRPAPEHEQAVAVELVERCLRSGRRALVLVPEAEPVPATVRSLEAAFADRVVTFLGGSKRARYRTWARLAAGEGVVVAATRPGVYAPLERLGLVLVCRESHPAHREDRSPYAHVREVALERARRAGAVCILAALCPSVEAWSLGLPVVAPRGRRWPPVEVVRPAPEGRAPRVVQALKTARRAFVYASAPGAGIAAVCRACGSPAACARCGGNLRLAEGSVRCTVCEAAGRCASCGAGTFGIRPGGAERVESWAARVAISPVTRLGADDRPRFPAEAGEVLVGGPDDVRDLGVGGLDLVAVLDADLADRRPGLGARERALATWMEAIGWARPGGRAMVQARRASDVIVQAAVRGNPDRFLAEETARREAAGFPVRAGVFRVAGDAGVVDALAPFAASPPLAASTEHGTVCLLSVPRDRIPAFGSVVRDLASRGVVTRVEAEPHL